MASENRHITRQKTTEALFKANGDLAQSAILTDTTNDLWAYWDDSKTNLHYMANQYHWTGAAIVYEDVAFEDVTAHGDIFATEYIKRTGGTDDSIRLQNDSIGFNCGGVLAMTFEDDKIYTSLFCGFGTSSPSALVHADAADGVADNNWVGRFRNQESTDGRNYGVIVFAGSTAADRALLLQDHDGANVLFTVQGNGTVGMGTGTPTSPSSYSNFLHISGTSSAVVLEDSEGGDVFEIGTNGGALSIRNGTDARTDIFVDGTGKVGINETAPQDTLEVNGTILVKDKLKFTQDSGSEYIDSLAANYIDIGYTSGLRCNTDNLFVKPLVGVGMGIEPTEDLHVYRNTTAAVTALISNPHASGSAEIALIGNTGGTQIAYLKLDNANDMTELAFAEDHLRIRDRGASNYIKVETSGSDYKINTSTSTLILGSAGSDCLTFNAADCYTVAWTEWSGSASEDGWSGTPTVDIWYKKIGKMVFVKFSIDGTSDAANAQFELPYACTTTAVRFTCVGEDNGSDITGGASGVINFNNASRVELQPDQGSNLNIAGWTSSGAKSVSGQFFYEATT